MRNAGSLISSRSINPILIPRPVVKAKSLKPSSSSKVSKNEASPRKQDPLKSKKGLRGPDRGLIRVSTSHGTSDHILTLKELHLGDLVDDQQQHTEVFINLSSQQHVSFGCSVDGRIVTSFDVKCKTCLCTYRREIDTSFHVWILQASRKKHENQMPEIGGDDPSAIYVKSGRQAYLDSLIAETIRLESIGNDTCSESCENTKPRTIVIIGEEHLSSFDTRWEKLLELKKGNLNSSA